jgi:DNA-binding transcriptional regulator YdaS (Cro superfamily)
MAKNTQTMNLQTWVISERGRSLSLAKALGVRPATVSNWVTRKKSVSVGQCMPIERATEGAVTRRDLRPDDFHIHWPDLAPAHAITAPAATENVAESGV